MGSRKKKEKRKKKRQGPTPPRNTRAPGSMPPKDMSDLLPPNAVLVLAPPGEVKMSEVLLKFVEPYQEYWVNETQMNKLLGLAVIAWNATLQSGNKRVEFIESMMNSIPLEYRRDARSLVDELIQRKEKHFAGIKRAIFNYKLAMSRSGPHVTVSSTPPLP